MLVVALAAEVAEVAEIQLVAGEQIAGIAVVETGFVQ